MKIPLYARNFEDRFTMKTKLEIWHDKKRSIVDIPFKPYFYSRTPRQISIARADVENLKFISDLHSEILYKYDFESVKSIPLYRDEDSLEADIPYLQRIAINDEKFYSNFSQTQELDMLYFDIETDTTGMFPKPKRNIIIAISYALNNSDVVTLAIDDIKEGDSKILKQFMEDIERLDPDVFVGYNMLSFDLPYIIDRLRLNGLSDEALTRGTGNASFINQEGNTIMFIQGRALFDVFMEVLKDQTLFGISGRGLKEVAKWFNIEAKVQQDPRYKDYKIILEYLGNMRALIGTDRLNDYIKSDVLITRALSEFYFKNIVTFAEMLGVPISLMTNRTANLIGTIVYARELRNQGIISDNPNFKRFPDIFGIPTFNERRGRYMFEGGTGMQGALVGIFKDGKSLPLFSELKEQFKNIWKLDFAGMYPSIQRTFRLSPETTKIISVEPDKKGELKYEKYDDYALLRIPDRKMGYVTIKILNKEGFLPRMLAEMHNKRQEIKKQLKDPKTPIHEKEALESLSWTIKVQQNMNYGINGSGYFRYGDVAVTIATTGLGRHFMQFALDQNPRVNIGCDTDGVYLTGKPDVNAYNATLNKYITETFGIRSYMALDMEGPFPNGYFLKRKNYLLQRPDGTIIKHGNSFKGTSKNILFAYALEKLSRAMFDEPDKIEATIKDCFKLNQRDIKDFIQKTRINKPIADYDSGGCLQVQVAKQMAKYHEIEIEQGDSIEYVKQETGYIIKDLAKMRNIDRKYYVRQVENVLKRLNLTQTFETKSKSLNGRNSFKRGSAGYMYESDGKISKQETLI